MLVENVREWRFPLKKCQSKKKTIAFRNATKNKMLFNLGRRQELIYICSDKIRAVPGLDNFITEMNKILQTNKNKWDFIYK